MKTIALIASLLFAACLAAVAQGEPTYQPQSLSVPATIPAVTSSNLASPPVLDVRKQQNVSIAFTAAVGASGTNISYTFAKSIDGIRYDSGSIVITLTNNTVSATQTTNLAVGGIGYLKLITINNREATGLLTNTAITYGIKISSP